MQKINCLKIWVVSYLCSKANLRSFEWLNSKRLSHFYFMEEVENESGHASKSFKKYVSIFMSYWSLLRLIYPTSKTTNERSTAHESFHKLRWGPWHLLSRKTDRNFGPPNHAKMWCKHTELLVAPADQDLSSFGKFLPISALTKLWNPAIVYF
jgi:hypothetical protein